METLGQELKRRREERKLSLREVSEATKIGVRFLQAMEADDFAVLPSGTYTRYFIRNYAKCLSINPEEAVSRYNKQTAQSEEVNEPQLAYKDFSTEPSRRSQGLVLIGLLGVITFGAWGLVHYLDRKATDKGTSPTIATNKTPEASPSGLSTATPQPGATEVPVNNTPTPAVTPIPLATDVTLTLKTKQQSWISVQSDDAANSQTITLAANETKDFKANSKIKVTIGNLPGVDVLINGQPAKLPSKKGSNGSVASVLINKENYREYLTAVGPTSDKTPTPPAPKATNTPLPTVTPTPTLTPTPSIVKPKLPPVISNHPNVLSTPAPTTTGTPVPAKPKPKPKTSVTTTSGNPGTATDPSTPKPIKPKPKPTGTATTGGSSTTTITTNGSTGDKPKVIKPKPKPTTTPTKPKTDNP